MKIIRKYHHTLKLKRLAIPSVGKDTEQLELSEIAGGNAKWHSHFGKQYVSIVESQTHIYSITLQFYFQVFTQEKLKHMSTQRSVHK